MELHIVSYVEYMIYIWISYVDIHYIFYLDLTKNNDTYEKLFILS